MVKPVLRGSTIRTGSGFSFIQDEEWNNPPLLTGCGQCRIITQAQVLTKPMDHDGTLIDDFSSKDPVLPNVEQYPCLSMHENSSSIIVQPAVVSRDSLVILKSIEKGV